MLFSWGSLRWLKACNIITWSLFQPRGQLIINIYFIVCEWKPKYTALLLHKSTASNGLRGFAIFFEIALNLILNNFPATEPLTGTTITRSGRQKNIQTMRRRRRRRAGRWEGRTTPTTTWPTWRIIWRPQAAPKEK